MFHLLLILGPKFDEWLLPLPLSTLCALLSTLCGRGPDTAGVFVRCLSVLNCLWHVGYWMGHFVACLPPKQVRPEVDCCG